MPRRCSIGPEPSTASAAGTDLPGTGPNDGLDNGPRPNLRGNYRGFLSAAEVNALHDSANSGAGLSLFGSGGAVSRHPILAALVVFGIVSYFSRKNR